MFVVTGSTGKVGGIVAGTLLEAGLPVRAIVRDADKGAAWKARGCAVAVVSDATDAEALAAAERDGVRGRDVTPFLLARFHAETGGDSLRANVQLVIANARLAARIAVARSAAA